MAFELPDLPYAYDALDPYISKADRLIDTPAGGYWAYHDWDQSSRVLVSGEHYTVGALIARADEGPFQQIDDRVKRAAGEVR